jgi:hypothetical protein
MNITSTVLSAIVFLHGSRDISVVGARKG